MKIIKKSKESLVFITRFGNVLSSILRFLRSVHSDLRSSLLRVSVALPAVLSILSTLTTLFTIIIQSDELYNERNKKTRATERMLLDGGIEKSTSSKDLDNPEKIQTTLSKDIQREIEKQRIFRIGGNAFLFMVYASLASLLIAFPGALPVVLTSIAIGQIVSVVRIGYAMYEKSHTERKFNELFTEPKFVPSINDNKEGKELFNNMLKNAVKNKVIMAVLNAVTVGVILSGLFFPPIAIAMNAMALILLGTTLWVSMRYHREKEQARKAIQDEYSNVKTPHGDLGLTSDHSLASSTVKQAIHNVLKHYEIPSSNMQPNVEIKDVAHLLHGTSRVKIWVSPISFFQQVGRTVLNASGYNMRRR
jgi:mRNA-degrading endonuclease HigB of HigAB toxin-antitoxin module